MKFDLYQKKKNSHLFLFFLSFFLLKLTKGRWSTSYLFIYMCKAAESTHIIKKKTKTAQCFTVEVHSKMLSSPLSFFSVFILSYFFCLLLSLFFLFFSYFFSIFSVFIFYFFLFFFLFSIAFMGFFFCFFLCVFFF